MVWVSRSSRSLLFKSGVAGGGINSVGKFPVAGETARRCRGNCSRRRGEPRFFVWYLPLSRPSDLVISVSLSRRASRSRERISGGVLVKKPTRSSWYNLALNANGRFASASIVSFLVFLLTFSAHLFFGFFFLIFPRSGKNHDISQDKRWEG